MSAELSVPDEAMQAACDTYEAAVLLDEPVDVDSSDLSTHAEVKATVAAAPLIVAAELERLADDLQQRADRRHAVAGDDEEPCEDECEETTCHTVAAVATYLRSVGFLRDRAGELRGVRKAEQR